MNGPSVLQRLLLERETLHLDVDTPERMVVHKAILERKSMIRNVFEEFHHEIMRLDEEHFHDVKGLQVEIGAGVCPLRNSYPHVLATDVVPADYLDKVIDAQQMDLDTGSVRAIYGQNCFHRLPDPRLFFRELDRVLLAGGGILIEPYYGFVASILYKHLFASEGFDKRVPDWQVEQDGPMHGGGSGLARFDGSKSVFDLSEFRAMRRLAKAIRQIGSWVPNPQSICSTRG